MNFTWEKGTSIGGSHDVIQVVVCLVSFQHHTYILQLLHILIMLSGFSWLVYTLVSLKFHSHWRTLPEVLKCLDDESSYRL